MTQIPWLYQAVVTALIALALSLLAAFLIYLCKQRVIASVEIVVDTRIDPNTIDVVVTNHGRSAIVITELKIYCPAKDVIPDWPIPIGPNFKKIRLFKLRRKLKTQGSRNDLLMQVAEAQLSQGPLTHHIIKETETMRVGPYEKAGRPLTAENLPPYLPKLDLPNPSTLIPSCKIAKRNSEIWGAPVIISKSRAGENDLPMVIKMNYK